MKKIVYISYDGALDPLGQSQIIPYLKGLSALDHKIYFVTYEKGEKLSCQSEVERVRRELKSANINWFPLKYHKYPTIPATLFDIFIGFFLISYLCLIHRIGAIHARSFIGAIPPLLLKIVYRKLYFIFDIRGFWPEERVDGNLCTRESRVYNYSKMIEKKLIQSANHIVVLTRKAEAILKADYPQIAPISVIPTCVNLTKFNIALKSEKSIKSQRLPSARTIYTYLGSLGTWYCFEEMVLFFQFLLSKSANSYFQIITPLPLSIDETHFIDNKLGRDNYLCHSVGHHEVPEYLAVSKATIFFIRPSYSKQSSCPTKLAESLALGIPVITNRGIGDCDTILEESRTGVLLSGFDQESFLKAYEEMGQLLSDPSVEERCRETAIQYFSLSDAVKTYHSIYELCSSEKSCHLKSAQ